MLEGGLDLPERRARLAELHAEHSPAALALILRLKGLFIKFGQVCSVRPELVPAAYRDKFKTLQSNVPGRPLAEVASVLEEDLGPLDSLFSFFAETPCGAASIGQAHKATIRATGREVVVKVQYPDAAWMVSADIRAIGDLLKLAVFFDAIDESAATLSFDEFSKQFMAELDYVQERKNLGDVQRSTGSSPLFADTIVVPEVVEALCSARVLTMSYLPGPKLEDEAKRQLLALGIDVKRGVKELVQEAADNKDAIDIQSVVPNSVMDGDGNVGLVGYIATTLFTPDQWLWVARTTRSTIVYTQSWAAYTVGGLSAVGLASQAWSEWADETKTAAATTQVNAAKSVQWMDTLFAVHGHEIFCTEVFNADPHPGNIIVLPDDKLGLIDYGQCKRLSPASRVKIAKVICAVADGKPDEDVAAAFRNLGIRTNNDSTAFIATFARLIFGRIRSEHLSHDWHMALHQTDKIKVFPAELVLVVRVAFLLRGLGLSLQYNIDIGERWKPFAEQTIANNGAV